MNNKLKQFFEENANNKFDWPELPAGNMYSQTNWILHECTAPWFEIHGIDAPYKAMLAEAQALKDMFVGHRDEEGKHQGWRSLAIHGIEATKTNIPETYGLDPNEVTYDWTEIQDRCPETVKFFKETFPYDDYMRVRFMLLEPGGYIMPHSDNQKCFLGAAINISLNQPDNCVMVNKYGTLPFRDEGSMFFFNNHYEHAVHNGGDTDRIHMIVHGRYNMQKLAPLMINSWSKQR